jgi:hypothetical protein
MKHHHAFGCPVFALENDLAAGSSILHWSPHACLGVNLGSSPSHARNIYLVLNLHTGSVSPQYHCQFDDFFETVRHGGPDISVPTAWQQLSGLTVMTRAPSMEYHDEVPRLFKRMQFGSNPVALSQESDNTSLLVTPLPHPSSSISICRISAMISLSQWPMREEQFLINLLSLLTTMQSSKMSLQVPEPVCEEGSARCQELWQSQCHNWISTVGTRCTTCCRKPCVSMTTTACTTAISTFKIACITLLHFSQK